MEILGWNPLNSLIVLPLNDVNFDNFKFKPVVVLIEVVLFCLFAVVFFCR